MKTDLKKKIIIESTRLFLQSGISETGVADIANAVGISKGTLYYHFKNKNAIIDAVATEYFIKVDMMFSTFLTDKRVIRNVKTLTKWLLYTLNSNVEAEFMHYMLLSYSAVKYPELKCKFKDKYIEWTELISSCIDRYKKTDDNYFYAKLVLSIIEGVAIRNVIGMENEPFDSRKLAQIIDRLL